MPSRVCNYFVTFYGFPWEICDSRIMLSFFWLLFSYFSIFLNNIINSVPKLALIIIATNMYWNFNFIVEISNWGKGKLRCCCYYDTFLASGTLNINTPNPGSLNSRTPIINTLNLNPRTHTSRRKLWLSPYPYYVLVVLLRNLGYL